MFDKTKKAAKTDKTKHARPFAYKTGDNIRPPFQPCAYGARELLNCTVASFYEISNSKLTSHQRQAKRNFIELFERQAKVSLEDLDDSDLDLYNTLTALMGYLDEFFFFGSLTNGSPPLIQNLVLTSFPPGMDYLGYCQKVEDKNWLPQFIISIDRYHQEHRGLPNFVSALVHEMTHTFLWAFVCRCPGCRRNEINTLGMEESHHGPTFRGLNYAVMVCMANWSAELDSYFRARSNGTYVDTASLNLEKAYIEGAKRSGDLKEMGMLPYIKNPSHRLLIRTSEHRIRIDVDRLRANVRRTAASVSKATSAISRTNRSVFSTGARSLGMELAAGLPRGQSNIGYEGQNLSVSSSDEDSEMDWSAGESMCIYCTSSSCGLPIHYERRI
ncbi:hypothetical protein F5B21DRAFT_506722 [Xylaria acuta]|nr:hypothetical protein F5B21DRAFT_506722 [Xylaria acuta]